MKSWKRTGPGGPPGLQNRSLPANAGGLGSTPRRFRQLCSLFSWGYQASVAIPSLDVDKLALYGAMRDTGMGKYRLEKILGWHLPQLNRVLTLRYRSRFDQI